jgi:hypothetical protein
MTKPPTPPAPVVEPDRSIPAGARMGTLRRHGLVEPYQSEPTPQHPQGRRMFRLNDRGLAHFAEIAAKKAKKSAGVGMCECQVCAAQVALVRGKTSLHGYSRPGFGFIVGSCRGAQELPFEVSCSILAKWIDEMRAMRATAERMLAHLPNRETFAVDVKKLLPGYTRVLDETGRDITAQANQYKEVYEWRKATRGVPSGYVMEREDVDASDPRFSSAREAERSELTNRIHALTQEIERQSARLASWAPRPLHGAKPDPDDPPF